MRLGEPATWETDALAAKTHVQKCGLVVVMTGVAPKIVQLFPLKFVLDSLSVRRIPDQWKDRPDAFDEHGPLRGISVVKRGLRLIMSIEKRSNNFCAPYLNAIVSVGISQQLLEPRSVKHLSDQKFTSSMLGHADTL